MDASLIPLVVAMSGLPLVSTFKDNFSLGAISAAWGTYNNATPGQTPVVVAGAATIPVDTNVNVSTATNYPAIFSLGAYKLQGDSFFAKVTRLVTDANDWGFSETRFFAKNWDDNSGVGFAIVKTSSTTWNLVCRTNNNTLTEWQDDWFTVAYDATAHAWLRVRESGNTYFWDVAPDAAGSPGTWTNLGSKTFATLTNFRPEYLAQSAHPEFNAGYWNSTMSTATITSQPTFDGLNTPVGAASVAYTSNASPASVTVTVAVDSDFVSGISNANPASVALTAAAATSRVGVGSIASPAAVSLTAAPASSSTGVQYSSVASPATITISPVATADRTAITSAASAATITATAAPGNDLAGTRGNALPAAVTVTPAPSTDAAAWKSSALAAVYTLTAAPAVALRAYVSIANPANVSIVGAAVTSYKAHNYDSFANAAAINISVNPTSDQTTGIEEVPPAPPPPLPPPIETISAAQFNDWLRDERARRIILLEMQGIDPLGNVLPLYFATSGYVSKINDSLQNRFYAPLIRGGLDFEQRINLDLTGEASNGDIELDNTEADLDYFFDLQFQYQPVRAFIGDATWPRQAFRKIYEGTVEDIDSSARDTVNVKLRDKLWRLDTPLHDFKVGGVDNDPEALMPVAFGDCHNVTPVLLDAAKLRYSYHLGMSERLIEVRDNGIPIQVSSAVKNVPSYFELLRAPSGRITCSVQGDYTSVNGYQDLVSDVIFTLLTGWGITPANRLKAEEIDLDNFFDFKQENLAPIGIYITEPTSVLETVNEIAASVGARLTQSIDGKIRLVRLEVPPRGAVVEVTRSDILDGSLQIVNRLPLVPSARLGYCRNWTVQQDTAESVPDEHRKLYAKEYLSISYSDEVLRQTYKLSNDAPEETTLIVDRVFALSELRRRLLLRIKQRHVVEFTGFADLMFTEVGSPIRFIDYPRFGIANKTGQVIATSIDWMNSRVKLQVLI